MPDSSTAEPESGFVCACEEWMRSTCTGGAFSKKHGGKRYCVLHYPAKEKREAFDKVLKWKLESKDFDFRGAWFPADVSFDNRIFTSKADFRGATFSDEFSCIGATFLAEAEFNLAVFDGDAYFRASVFDALSIFGRATFRGKANFRSAVFKGLANFNTAVFNKWAGFNRATFRRPAIFDGATFKDSAEFHHAVFQTEANFSHLSFETEAQFISSEFNGRANFISTTFGKKVDFGSSSFAGYVDFFSATFLDHVTFAGGGSRTLFSNQSSLDLQYTIIGVPEHFLFHTVSLHPHWFINVDPRKFNFTNVNWLSFSLEREIQALKSKGIASPARMLEIAFRHLAFNAEENHRYQEASTFRYKSLETQRKERVSGFGVWKLSWWYWLASGYGERMSQAFLVLLGLLFLFALLYTRVGFARWEPKLANESDVASAKRDDVGAPLRLGRALTYSAAVMTFQKPEPRPATIAAQSVVLVETILGPVQAALLALAIRRKFMR